MQSPRPDQVVGIAPLRAIEVRPCRNFAGLFATCSAFTRSAPSRRAQSRWRNSRAGTARWSGSHPQHRVVLPLTGAAARKVTVQLEGDRPRLRLASRAGLPPGGRTDAHRHDGSTSLHLLWTPDPATSAKLDPLLPFEDPLIAANARAMARQLLDSAAPDRLFIESLGNAIVIKLMRHFSTADEIRAPRGSGLSRRAATTHHRLCRRPSRRGAEPGRHRIGGLPQPLSSQPVVPPCHGYRASPLRRPTPHRLRPPAGARDRFVDG